MASTLPASNMSATSAGASRPRTTSRTGRMAGQPAMVGPSSFAARSSPAGPPSAPEALPFFKVSSGMTGQASAGPSTSRRSGSSSAKSPLDTGRADAAGRARKSSSAAKSAAESADAASSKAAGATDPNGSAQTSSSRGRTQKDAPSAANGSAAQPPAQAPASSNGKGAIIAERPRPSASSTDSESPQPSSEKENGKRAPRRRKANRACMHCQKAHLTCDDSRPCERCVKKGLADTCTDGARKKAKYLLDEDELLELKKEKERKEHGGEDGAASDAIHDSVTTRDADMQQGWSASGQNPNIGYDVSVPTQSASDLSYAPNTSAQIFPSQIGSGTNEASSQQLGDANYYQQLPQYAPVSGQNGFESAFGSESASLEYSILSSMLNGIDPSWLGSPAAQPPSGDMNRILGGTSDLYGQQQAQQPNGAGWGGSNSAQGHSGDNVDVSPWLNVAAPAAPNLSGPQRARQDSQPLPPLHRAEIPSSTEDGATAYDALEVPSPGRTASVQGSDGQSANLSLDGPGHSVQDSKALAAAAAAGLDHKPDAVWTDRVRHVYGDRTQPFPYTDGYHFLIKYATANLDKADVLRLIRALAIFRPSLIALQMPLTEDDEVYVERGIQRAILEFEKLISFSGTPTVVWRRTCEVVVVGAEFSMLTQWSRDALRGRYIYEFFEKSSVLEYWEKFAAHAFENTAQSIMMPITLKTSSGGTTRCAACISIKRDMFDLPSLIVGNFLPILG